MLIQAVYPVSSQSMRSKVNDATSIVKDIFGAAFHWEPRVKSVDRGAFGNPITLCRLCLTERRERAAGAE